MNRRGKKSGRKNTRKAKRHEKGQYTRYQRDPKDEKYINLALVTKANYIVSRDNDLMDETRKDGREFRARFPMLTILDPVEFLNRLAAPPNPDEP